MGRVENLSLEMLKEFQNSIDRLFSRTREQKLELDTLVEHQKANDERLDRLETNSRETVSSVDHLKHDAERNKRDFSSLHGTLDEINHRTYKLTEDLTTHIRAEAEDYAKQSMALESVSRKMVSLFVVFFVLTLLVTSLYNIFTGNVPEFVVKAIGL
jgi:peptidoglycan hydrolase CwlO-like protein